MLKIYSWNINGIRAVMGKNLLLPFLTKEHPDILCLQEIKAKQEQATLHLPNYDQIWYSAEKPGYSGTAIFSKSKILSTSSGFPQSIIGSYKMSGDVYGDPNKEGRVLTAEYEPFYVVSVYTPNAKDNLSRLTLRQKHWDPGFLAYVQQLEKKKPVIFCGDLNVAHTPDDLARPKENKGKKGYTTQEREGFQRFLDAGFVDTFRLFTQGPGHYSWWTHWANARARNVGWRIDYILVSKQLENKVKAADIHTDVFGSDHCPVSVTMDISL
ncbi:MAG TPA: exodeoxyribonuclease III [Candidatus Saccharimonadales bacterium]|nr:exodeoxyribonuclease III [Candidatus Saccharimonadales bacterium]